MCFVVFVLLLWCENDWKIVERGGDGQRKPSRGNFLADKESRLEEISRLLC
jgi:hypothetical protein